MSHPPRHLALRGGLLVCAALCSVGVFSASATAQDSAPAASRSTRFEPPGVLVLIGGTLVEGRISESASGYLVDLPKGRYVVPFERVLLAARDKRDAYAKQRANMQRPSPSRHFELAQWCLRYRMLDEAKSELRSALRLAGNYAPARDLLQDIEQLERPRDPKHLRSDESPAKTDDGYDVPESVSIAGLSPEAAQHFTSRIQPLLVNSCGNAGCHGGSEPGEFALQHVRFGRAGIRTKTQQNLAAALKYVDFDHPQSSPLLTKPSALHGGGRRPVFDGRGGRRQRDLLEQWVLAAAADLAPERASSDREATTKDAVTGTTPPQSARPTQTQTDPSRQSPDLLDRILDEERPDAFDPEAFNRQLDERRETRLAPDGAKETP